MIALYAMYVLPYLHLKIEIGQRPYRLPSYMDMLYCFDNMIGDKQNLNRGLKCYGKRICIIKSFIVLPSFFLKLSCIILLSKSSWYILLNILRDSNVLKIHFIRKRGMYKMLMNVSIVTKHSALFGLAHFRIDIKSLFSFSDLILKISY